MRGADRSVSARRFVYRATQPKDSEGEARVARCTAQHSAGPRPTRPSTIASDHPGAPTPNGLVCCTWNFLAQRVREERDRVNSPYATGGVGRGPPLRLIEHP